MLYDDYAECAQRYKELYGEAVLVAYEVGKFYEWYNCDGDRGCDVRGVCELLNLVCTRKSKAIPEISRSNPLMAGVPVSAFPKYVPTLLDAGYTVVVVSQVLVSEGDTPSSRVFDRRVTEVLSKGTYVHSSVTSAEHPHHRPVCMCICLDWHRESTAMPGPVHDRRAASASSPAVVHAGCAYADASTGACACCEVNSTRTDVGAAQDELHRIVADWCPTEVLLVGRRPPGFDVRAFSYHLGIDPEDVRDRLRPKESKKEEGEEEDEESRKTAETTCFSTKHHEHVLRRTYGAHSTGFLSVTEALDLEMHPHARAAFVALLTFLEEHGERCATGVRRPHVRQDDFVEGDDDDDDETTTASSQRRRLTLSYNAARQLDVISFSSRGGSGKSSLAKDGTLHGLLDVCVTSQGRRFMREQLMAPLTDAGAVRRRLDAVEFVMEGRRYVEVRNALGRVIDLERLFRRLVVGTGVPRDFESLQDALCATTAATEAVVHSSSSSFSSFVAKLRSDVAVLWESLSDLASSKDDGGGGINNKTGDAAFERNVFRRGVRPDLDALQERADGLHANFIATCRACNRHLPLTGGHAAFRLDVTTAVPSSPSSPAFRQYAITGTTKRCASLLNQLREAGGRTHDGDMVGPATSVFLRPANANASQVWTPAMEAWNAEAIEVDAALRSGAKEAFSAFVKDFVSDHRDRMWRLVTAVAYLDFVAAGAYVADDRRYVRPRVNYAGPSSSSSCGSSSSSFRARGLRHPVVEALNRDVPHVSNDVRLGVFDDGDTVPPVGLLLYGMNAAGKSCLMKAVGLAVVMAQAGCSWPRRSWSWCRSAGSSRASSRVTTFVAVRAPSWWRWRSCATCCGAATRAAWP